MSVCIDVKERILFFFLLLQANCLGSAWSTNQTFQFEKQYILDKTFAASFEFQDVTDIAINLPQNHILVLQRSRPPLTLWNTNGTFLMSWDTKEIGYPHSITLNGSDPSVATVWITDFAGALLAGNSYGHCVKQFSYYGEFIKSIGKCGKYTNGSSINPIQFDKVTDIAWNSKGYVFITDGDLNGLNNRVIVLNQALEFVDVWNARNQPGSDPGEFNLPHMIAVDKCDRIWITDTMNHRIQVFNEYGKCLGEFKCFVNMLVYGIDFFSKDEEEFVIVTTKNTKNNQSGLAMVAVKMNCKNLEDIGDCKIDSLLIPNWYMSNNSSAGTMFHSVTVDSQTGNLYVTKLPGQSPPLRFFPVVNPPIGDKSSCSIEPPQWPSEWNASVLLTPYTNERLVVADMVYSSTNNAMLVILDNDLEILTIDDLSYTIVKGNGITHCSGPIKYGWRIPSRNWLGNRHCKCYGSINSSGVETVLWQCKNYQFVDWIWFECAKMRPWRMFLNNETNPSGIPVLGNFTTISFASYGIDTSQVKKAIDFCNQSAQKVAKPSLRRPKCHGFSYEGCDGIHSLRSWPERFYLTATMLPINFYDPMPTQVIYDWSQQSQHTILFNSNAVSSAYLIHNETFIVNKDLVQNRSVCSRLNFGPPNPHWMFTDKCKCMGTIKNNSMLSPWPSTVIAVCPLENGRVFWTWFGIETNSYNYTPVIFLETLAPPHEGTNLAFADYHDFYPGKMLVNVFNFIVPKQCF